MTRVTLEDPLLDAQLLRVMGAAPYGGADVAECLLTARRVRGRRLTSWSDEWTNTAERALTLGDNALDRGERETARLAFLRASSYFRIAGITLLSPPLDERLVASYAKQRDAFRRATNLMETPPDVLELSFDGIMLPGYFFRAADDGVARPTCVLTGGYDSTVEELYLTNGAAALARGYNVLAFDGPVQGTVLTEQRVPLRPDWENVVRPVIDYAVGRSDVDSDRMALIGPSLGGYLAPRAASEEHRLAALIVDCGPFDVYANFLARLPGPLARRLDAGNRTARRVTARLLEFLRAKPTAGWPLRRGLLVHGTDDPLELIEMLKSYTLKGRAEQITCPTWVCNAEGDDISASAPELVAALRCEKEYVKFTAAEGADDHCEAGAHTLYHARSFAWLDAVMHQRRANAPEPNALRATLA